MTQKVTELLQVLADRGLSDEAIVNVRDGLWMQASERFMTDMLGALSEEELKTVEDAPTQEEANRKLAAVYKEKTGKDMQEEMGRIVDEYAQELIEKHKMENAAPVLSENTASQATTVSDTAPSPVAPEVPPASTTEDVVHDL